MSTEGSPPGRGPGSPRGICSGRHWLRPQTPPRGRDSDRTILSPFTKEYRGAAPLHERSTSISCETQSLSALPQSPSSPSLPSPLSPLPKEGSTERAQQGRRDMFVFKSAECTMRDYAGKQISPYIQQRLSVAVRRFLEQSAISGANLQTVQHFRKGSQTNFRDVSAHLLHALHN